VNDTWRHHAACAGSDPNDWVWINSNKLKDGRKAARLKQICATCPVAKQCLDAELEAMRNGDASYGVFGGTDAYERRTMLGMSTHARQLHKPSTPMAHGTVAGYVKHTRYPEIFGPPCAECRWVHNQRSAEFKRDKRAQRIRTGVADWVSRDHPTLEETA